MVKAVLVYRVSVRKPEGKRPLGRPRRRWEDNIKMYLQEGGCGGMDWIELAQDRDRWRAELQSCQLCDVAHDFRYDPRTFNNFFLKIAPFMR